MLHACIFLMRERQRPTICSHEFVQRKHGSQCVDLEEVEEIRHSIMDDLHVYLTLLDLNEDQRDEIPKESILQWLHNFCFI